MSQCDSITFSLQVLCHCKTIEISHDHYEKGGRRYDTKYMDIASIIIVYPNIC